MSRDHPLVPFPQRRSDAPALLVVSERLPRADESAGSRRLLAILDLLARRHPVDLWVERDETTGRRALSPARVAEARARLAAAGVHVLPTGWRPLTKALTGPPYAAALFEFYAMAARYAAFVRQRQPGIRAIVDSVDLHWVRLAAGAAVGAESARRARRVRRLEMAVYRSSDAVLVASTDDACALSAEGDLPPVHCVPTIAPVRPRAPGPREREALFVAHFDHAPNVDGLRWFVREVWPRVRARDAGARLTVVGTRVTAEVRAFGAEPGVAVVGYVPDVAPYLDRARLAVAPLRYGAGMKGKVTEAMAAGVPVVTTSVGAQGLEVVSGEHVLLADEAAPFAAAVAALLDDPARAERIGLAGQRYVAGVCAPEIVGPQLEALLQETLARPPRRPSTRAAALARRLRRWWLGSQHSALSLARRAALLLPRESIAPAKPALGPRDSDTRVAVIVCTRGRGGRVVDTVRSILASSVSAFELYVVDQNEDGSTRAVLDEAVADPRLRCLTSPRGLSIGRNTAAEATKAELLAFTDDDCTVTPEWLAELTAPFASDPRVGIVFGSVRAAPHDRRAGFIPSYQRSEPFLARTVFDKHRVEGIGASMAVRRSVWLDLHGFDELLGAGAPLRSAEETDFTIRALLAGHFVAETPRAAVIHYGFRSWDAGRAVIHGYLHGIGATLAKHVKRGRWSVLAVAARLALRWTVARPVVDLGPRSYRWTRLAGFTTGVLRGLATPVDRATGHFRRTPGCDPAPDDPRRVGISGSAVR